MGIGLWFQASFISSIWWLLQAECILRGLNPLSMIFPTKHGLLDTIEISGFAPKESDGCLVSYSKSIHIHSPMLSVSFQYRFFGFLPVYPKISKLRPWLSIETHGDFGIHHVMNLLKGSRNAVSTAQPLVKGILWHSDELEFKISSFPLKAD